MLAAARSPGDAHNGKPLAACTDLPTVLASLPEQRVIVMAIHSDGLYSYDQPAEQRVIVMACIVMASLPSSA